LSPCRCYILADRIIKKRPFSLFLVEFGEEDSRFKSFERAIEADESQKTICIVDAWLIMR